MNEYYFFFCYCSQITFFSLFNNYHMCVYNKLCYCTLFLPQFTHQKLRNQYHQKLSQFSSRFSIEYLQIHLYIAIVANRQHVQGFGIERGAHKRIEHIISPEGRREPVIQCKWLLDHNLNVYRTTSKTLQYICIYPQVIRFPVPVSIILTELVDE